MDNAPLPYSPSVRAGDFLFVSGQIGRDPETGVVADGLMAQAKTALANLEHVLAESGATMSQVVKFTVYLADMAEYQMMNRAWEEVLSAPFPARSAVAVSGLPAATQIEIDAVAYLG